LISTQISRASAGVLALGGLVLLFASDVVLPRLLSGFPASAAWLGQLLAAAWLAVGVLNWLSRSALLGGIYGRPIVVSNAVLYFVSTTVLLNFAARPDASTAIWIAIVPAVAFAATYAWLLFRGPLARDFASRRDSQ
jgi:hypothetical protein